MAPERAMALARGTTRERGSATCGYAAMGTPLALPPSFLNGPTRTRDWSHHEGSLGAHDRSELTKRKYEPPLPGPSVGRSSKRSSVGVYAMGPTDTRPAPPGPDDRQNRNPRLRPISK